MIWLNVAEQRRLNGFQARCLRKVLGIKHAFVSRISNADVLKAAGQIDFSKQLLRQQLKLYQKIACLKDGSKLRELTFGPGSLRPATDRYIRKLVGPRANGQQKYTPMQCRLLQEALRKI